MCLHLFKSNYARLILGVHVYALVTFGATFWIDSLAYIQLADALRFENGLAEFYAAGGRWIYSHIQAGLPVVWLTLNLLPESLRWPVLALFQHIVAAGALFFTINTINRYWPTRLHFITLLILLFLPAYQSFHNALLTESLTSSLLLIAFASCLRIAFDLKFQARYFFIVLAALMLITQFRSYWGLAVTGMLFVTLLRRRLVWSFWTPVLLVTALASATAFPIYRYTQMGELFLPEGGMNILISGFQVNSKPSDVARSAFSGIQFPPEAQPSILFDKGLDWLTALKIAKTWQDSGLSNSAINKRATELGSALRNDGSGIQLNRVIYGIASLGSVEIFTFGNKERQVFRGMSTEKMFEHQVYYYRWHSWISNDNYEATFASFFNPTPISTLPFEHTAKSQIKSAWEPYLSVAPGFLRDPFLLGKLPPDVWLLLGLMSLTILLWRIPFVALLLSCSIVIVFFTSAWFPLGNTRYANPLIPLYILSTSIAMGSFLKNSSYFRKVSTGSGGESVMFEK